MDSLTPYIFISSRRVEPQSNRRLASVFCSSLRAARFALTAEIEPRTAERVTDGVATHVVPLSKLVRGCSGLVVLNQELDDRPVEGVLPGERVVVGFSC